MPQGNPQQLRQMRSDRRLVTTQKCRQIGFDNCSGYWTDMGIVIMPNVDESEGSLLKVYAFTVTV